MTNRKPITEPAVPPDTDFGNYITSRHDQAVSEITKLDGQIENRKEYYVRERKRLDSQEAQEMASLSTQRGQQQNIVDMALAALSAHGTVDGIRLVASNGADLDVQIKRMEG